VDADIKRLARCWVIDAATGRADSLPGARRRDTRKSIKWINPYSELLGRCKEATLVFHGVVVFEPATVRNEF
jgi:hypothetical protein